MYNIPSLISGELLFSVWKILMWGIIIENMLYFLATP